MFFQGHPEYDANSLLKEYKREVLRFMDGETDSYPPFPENYFTLQTGAILAEYRERVEAARNKGPGTAAIPGTVNQPITRQHLA